MKKIKIFAGMLAMLFASQVLFAQTINTQGVLRNADGNAMDDGDYSVSFTIYDDATAGNNLWQDTYSLQVNNGVFNVTLGSDANPIDMLTAGQPYWIGVKVGSDAEMSPRLKLSTTPYEQNYLTGNQNTFPGTGNVGIGTTSPAAQLSLGRWSSGGAGTTNGSQLLLSGQHNSGVNAGGYKLKVEGYDNDGSEVYPIFVQDENSGADFWLKNRPSASSRSTAYFQGNVGIGTTAPDARLDVEGNLSLGSLNSGNALIIPSNNITYNFSQWGTGLQVKTASSVDRQIYFHNEGSGTMQLLTDGNVGIGTTSPQERLHVLTKSNENAIRLEVGEGFSGAGEYWNIEIDHQAGDADIVFKSHEGGYAWLEPTDGAFNHSSDRRLKKNIMPMTGVLNQVMRLKPSTYHMKSENADTKKKVGFIAQDVQEVFPDLGIVGEQDGMLGLSYADFSVLSIAAIQEQQEIIDRQQMKIDELEKRLARIEASLGK